MTSQFDPHPKFNPSIARPTREPWHDDEDEENLPWLDDRFELLSAYLDGEANAEERQQVEAWLATDTEAQKLYDRMSNLHRDFQALPIPTPTTSVQAIADGVFDRLDQQRQRRNLRWGGAIAAALIAVVSGTTLNTRSYTPQMAQSPQAVDNEPQVAFDREAGHASVSSHVPNTSIVSRALFVE